MDRLVTLSKIIEALQPIKGEKSLQKLIYLINTFGHGLGYQFSWNNYGPLSFQLQHDIDECLTLGLVSIIFEDDVPVYRGSNQSALTPFWQQLLDECILDPQSKQLIDQIQSWDSARKDPQFLEIIASMDYLQRHQRPAPSSWPADLTQVARTTLQHFNLT